MCTYINICVWVDKLMIDRCILHDLAGQSKELLQCTEMTRNLKSMGHALALEFSLEACWWSGDREPEI